MKWSWLRKLAAILMFSGPIVGLFFRVNNVVDLWNSMLLALAITVSGIGVLMVDNLEMM